MPVPKRKTSKSRRNKRRTHHKIPVPAVVICPATGVAHDPHTSYTHDGNTYYRGKLLRPASE